MNAVEKVYGEKTALFLTAMCVAHAIDRSGVNITPFICDRFRDSLKIYGRKAFIWYNAPSGAILIGKYDISNKL